MPCLQILISLFLLIIPSRAFARNINSELITAAMKNKPDIVRNLLNKGADANATTIDGYNALILSAFNGSQPIVQILLDNGADVHAKTLNGETALMWAALRDHADIVQRLIDNG
ncbi:MAG: ankyrin repeat domain-containing protein, partial [Planctomycetota bacterium]